MGFRTNTNDTPSPGISTDFASSNGMTIQTRSAAKKARENPSGDAVVLTSRSATGEGVHKSWKYSTNSPPSAVTQKETIQRKDSSNSSLSSITSRNSLFDGSLSSLSPTFSVSSVSSVEQDEPSTDPKAPASPPRPLARSPAGRWTTDGTTMRMVIVPDDLSEEATQRRMDEAEGLHDRIFERELANLMREKRSRERAFGINQSDAMATDSDETESDTDKSDQLDRLSDIMEEDEEQLQANRSWSNADIVGARNTSFSNKLQRRPRKLGPCGTELIDHSSGLTGSNGAGSSIYPEKWAKEPSNTLRWRRTEEW